MPQIDISTKNYTRLQNIAVPLVDTPDDVLGRLLDAYEATGKVEHVEETTGMKTYDPEAPPNLTYTTLKTAKLDGQSLPRSATFWNSLMITVIQRAASKVGSIDELVDLIPVPCTKGRKEDNGYKFLSDVGISVQGQDANSAWKAIYALAASFHFAIEVTFTWQNTPKAAAPNTSGSFVVQGGRLRSGR